MIRAARPGDTDALIALWHGAWHDGHAHLVPPDILPLRTPAHFRMWWADDPAPYWVATGGERLLGFVSVHGAELSRLFVAPDARGTGLAVEMLRHGEALLAQGGVARAHLFCLDGNDRAERFYRREGWEIAERGDSPLWYPPGESGAAVLPTLRLEKTLAGRGGASATQKLQPGA